MEILYTHLYKRSSAWLTRKPKCRTVKAAEIAHRYGLKVDTYIQWNTMMYETFFAEEPRAKNWMQRDALGQPILLVYGFQQSFSLPPLFRQPGLPHLPEEDRPVRRPEKSRRDFIHFDNSTWTPSPTPATTRSVCAASANSCRPNTLPARRKALLRLRQHGLRQSSAVERAGTGPTNLHILAEPGHPGMDGFPLPADGRRPAADGRLRQVR